MREEAKEIASVISNHPKTAGIAAIIGNYLNVMWLDWGSALVDAIASILGVILLIYLLRRNHLEIKKLKKESN